MLSGYRKIIVKHTIIVHGGAWDIPRNEEKAHLRGCEKAAQLGEDILKDGGSALDAVEAAVVSMEEDPIFDAGKGSVLNQSGQVEMDAIIMDGTTLRSGAVAALRHIRNPVRVARVLMENTPYAFLAGAGALKFAVDNGFEECAEEDLLVGRELEDYREFIRTGVLRTKEVFAGERHDTVGACALDKAGRLAAATSTGGIPRKLAGRVGDSPLIGCGAYADDKCGAASATGWGEQIMAVVLSKTALDVLKECGDPLKASRRAINILSTRVNGYGGIIMVSKDGRTGLCHNTPKMAYSFAGDRKRKTGIKM
jgi:beta-aspartyl-peptidase (threonine type)